MYVANSEFHLRRARTLDESQGAIAEYMKAIEAAVREIEDVCAASLAMRR